MSSFSHNTVFPQRAIESIVYLLQRIAQPIYMGDISIEIGYSLNRTEEMLGYLESVGIVRKLLTSDLKKFGFREDTNVYVFVDCSI